MEVWPQLPEQEVPTLEYRPAALAVPGASPLRECNRMARQMLEANIRSVPGNAGSTDTTPRRVGKRCNSSRLPSYRLALITQRIGEQFPKFRCQVYLAAFGLGAGGAEFDEPVLKIARAIASSVSFIRRFKVPLSSRTPRVAPILWRMVESASWNFKVNNCLPAHTLESGNGFALRWRLPETPPQRDCHLD